MSKRRGKNAACSGRYGEDTFEALLRLAGFVIVDNDSLRGERATAVRQYPVPHPFRPNSPRSGKNDFMLFVGKQKIYCQVKNQNSSGTCDEKLSFAFDIARYAVNDDPYDTFALILLGTWWRDNHDIVEWAKTKATEFECLARGTRRTVSAIVLVGPNELSIWLNSLGIDRELTSGTLFDIH